MYPQLLNPTSIELFYLENKEIQIPKCIIYFDKCAGKTFKETFGGKPVVCINNKPMFAELAIMTYFEMSGWKSRWIETYGRGKGQPAFLSEWKDNKFKNQIENPIRDKKILKILSNIASINNKSYSGCWDVIGWNSSKIIFAESKRMNKDKIRQTQINWLSAGFKYGLTAEDFVVVQWDIREKPLEFF